MLDKSIKTPDRVAGNSVMKKVLLGTIVGCLVGTLLAVGGIAILIANLMTSSAGGGSGGRDCYLHPLLACWRNLGCDFSGQRLVAVLQRFILGGQRLVAFSKKNK